MQTLCNGKLKRRPFIPKYMFLIINSLKLDSILVTIISNILTIDLEFEMKST